MKIPTISLSSVPKLPLIAAASSVAAAAAVVSSLYLFEQLYYTQSLRLSCETIRNAKLCWLVNWLNDDPDVDEIVAILAEAQKKENKSNDDGDALTTETEAPRNGTSSPTATKPKLTSLEFLRRTALETVFPHHNNSGNNCPFTNPQLIVGEADLFAIFYSVESRQVIVTIAGSRDLSDLATALVTVSRDKYMGKVASDAETVFGALVDVLHNVFHHNTAVSHIDAVAPTAAAAKKDKDMKDIKKQDHNRNVDAAIKKKSSIKDGAKNEGATAEAPSGLTDANTTTAPTPLLSPPPPIDVTLMGHSRGAIIAGFIADLLASQGVGIGSNDDDDDGINIRVKGEVFCEPTIGGNFQTLSNFTSHNISRDLVSMFGVSRAENVFTYSGHKKYWDAHLVDQFFLRDDLVIV